MSGERGDDARGGGVRIGGSATVGGDVVGRDKTSHYRLSRGRAEAPERVATGRTSDVSAVRVFISHSSADAQLAGRVANLLRSALGLKPMDIRCSSIDRYRLPAGADVDEQVRAEVREAEALVALISRASLESLYVAFELGARWGLGKSLIPLMAPGVSASELKGPLAGVNALSADSPTQLHQLVEDLGKVLGIAPDRPTSYQSDVDAIVSMLKA